MAEDLTNAEIRQQLIELGANVGPVTATTRSVYIKRLNKLKLEKLKPHEKLVQIKSTVAGKQSKVSNQRSKKPLITPQRKAFGFSTDESDNEENSMQKNHKSSRSNLRSRAVRQTARNYANRRPAHSETKPTLSPITNGYSDDSDGGDASSNGSWVEIASANTNTSPGLLNSNSRLMPAPRRSLHNRGKSDSPLSFGNTAKSLPDDRAYLNRNNELDESSSPRQAYANSPKNSNFTRGNSQKETKNGSNLIWRRAVKQSMAQNNNFHADAIDNDSNKQSGTLEENKRDSKPNMRWKIFSYFCKSKSPELEDDTFTHSTRPSPKSWSLHCSVLLPIFAVIFFVILGLLYVTMPTDHPSARNPTLQSSTSNKLQADENNIMVAVNDIYQVLATAAGNKICLISHNDTRLSVNDVKSMTNKPIDASMWFKALGLIRKHTEWEVFLYKNRQGDLVEETDSLADVTYLETTRPILPDLCRLRRAVEKVTFRVGLVICAGLLVWLAIMYRQYRVRKYEEERLMMFGMIEQILDILKKNYESSLEDENIEPFIPILHVRDMVIPPRERRSKSSVWEKAVQFISASESRIRVESQRISGEDYRVWRWIQVTSPNKRLQAPNRVWQGEAFDTNRSINTPNISPTPCLKIRNMFDPDVEKDADWHLQVQDSILEKCSDNNDIVSIVVEKSSREGVVYVKCGSRPGAGRAFRSLHGSWFDGRLVTVKFIKLQRFHARYPRTVDQNTPLKPSSTKPVSTFLPQPAIPGNGDFSTSTPIKSAS